MTEFDKLAFSKLMTHYPSYNNLQVSEVGLQSIWVDEHRPNVDPISYVHCVLCAYEVCIFIRQAGFPRHQSPSSTTSKARHSGFSTFISQSLDSTKSSRVAFVQRAFEHDADIPPTWVLALACGCGSIRSRDQC